MESAGSRWNFIWSPQEHATWNDTITCEDYKLGDGIPYDTKATKGMDLHTSAKKQEKTTSYEKIIEA